MTGKLIMPPHEPTRVPKAGLCDTCVTPGYCNRTGDCAQGKQNRSKQEKPKPSEGRLSLCPATM